MKNKLNIILSMFFILVCSVLVFSCKKDEKRKQDYYLAQTRDSLLVGKFQLILEDSIRIQYFEFKINGELLRLSVRNRKTTVSATDYWYTKGSTVLPIVTTNRGIKVHGRIKIPTASQLKVIRFS